MIENNSTETTTFTNNANAITLAALAVALLGFTLAGCGGLTGEDFEVAIDANKTEGEAPLEVQFDGRATHRGDPVEDIDGRKIQKVDYKWEEGVGEDSVIGREPQLTHTFDEPGEYIVRLEVDVSRSSDARGATDWYGDDTVTINVSEPQ
jgi:PKD repeat protein